MQNYLMATSFGWVKVKFIFQPLFYQLTNIIIPDPVFENVFNPSGTTYNYSQIFDAIRYLEIVNNYRANNPTATAKLFLYTPGVGIGDPSKWKWIFILKN
jgi:hypothetical protein